MINVTKLDEELKTAGIPIFGCSSDGHIDFKPEATQAHRDLAATILAAHNPAWGDAEWDFTRHFSKLEKAAWLTLLDELRTAVPAFTTTNAQFRDKVIAKAKTLP